MHYYITALQNMSYSRKVSILAYRVWKGLDILNDLIRDGHVSSDESASIQECLDFVMDEIPSPQ
jgi:hypothetical protein